METELKSLRIDPRERMRREPKPWIRKVTLAGVLLLIAISALFAYEKATAPLKVRAIQVRAPAAEMAGDQQIVLTETGYIVAAHKIEVASKVVGRVAWIGVEKGDKVQAGQVIVRLEDDEYRAQVLQQEGQLKNLEAKLQELKDGSRPDEIGKARADLEEAKAEMADAKATLERTQKLFSEGVLSRQALDDAQAKYNGDVAKVQSLQRTLDLAILGPREEEIQQVEGQIEQARGALAYARTQLENTIIRAPVSGTILDRNVEKGEFVTTGFVGDKGAKGYLVTMADLKDLQVELDINESDFPKLGPHQKAWITTDAYPDRKYAGEIEEISPEADRAKATIQVKVKILNPDDYLRPDMNATVLFFNQTNGNREGTSVAITVPAAAVKENNVFLIVNGRVRKRPVTVGGTTRDGVLIERGLLGGEEIVVNPPQNLKDGQRVKAEF
jgi:HlyD family secretion protein